MLCYENISETTVLATDCLAQMGKQVKTMLHRWQQILWASHVGESEDKDAKKHCCYQQAFDVGCTGGSGGFAGVEGDDGDSKNAPSIFLVLQILLAQLDASLEDS